MHIRTTAPIIGIISYRSQCVGVGISMDLLLFMNKERLRRDDVFRSEVKYTVKIFLKRFPNYSERGDVISSVLERAGTFRRAYLPVFEDFEYLLS